MDLIKIKDDILFVGANDPDRRIFDQLIPLPDGTSYNSYLIKGSEKIALIDTVDPTKKEILIENLKKAGINSLDYVIAHHGEQDHSGSIPEVLEEWPRAKVVTNQKCKIELMDLLLIPDDKFIVIDDGEELSLGNKTLKFIFAPWVHWPETFLSYLSQDKILFTCDFLGSHFAIEDVFVKDNAKIYKPAKRYYAQIMMPFRSNIRNNLEKIKDLNIDIIAPSHGPLYRDKSFIIGCYEDWVSEKVKNEVVIPYISMHGSTNKIVEHFISALEKRGIIVKAFNLADADIGELAMALVDAATAVIGSPTVLTGPHPKAIFAAYLVKALRPKLKFLSVIGSYGWGGKVVETMSEMLSSLNAEIIEPVIIKGYPKENDYKIIENLADKIKDKHRELELL